MQHNTKQRPKTPPGKIRNSTANAPKYAQESTGPLTTPPNTPKYTPPYELQMTTSVARERFKHDKPVKTI